MENVHYMLSLSVQKKKKKKKKVLPLRWMFTISYIMSVNLLQVIHYLIIKPVQQDLVC